MRRVRYGVGMSLDGFIADRLDGTSWMAGDPGYDSKPFLASIDTVLVGRRSYEVMLRHRSRSYPGLRTFVFSRTLRGIDYPEVTVLGDNGLGTSTRSSLVCVPSSWARVGHSFLHRPGRTI